jgi:hypothetical protein
MLTIHLIRAHLTRIPRGVPFTTRDCLCYGKRSAVDTALHRLVKKDIIIRLARGVYIRWSLEVARGAWPAALEVAQIKARGFGKELFMHKQDAAAKFGLIESGNETPTFGTFGRSTSFKFGQERIRLVHAIPKDAKDGDTLTGLFIRALRQLGNHEDLPKTVMNLTQGLSKLEKSNLSLAAACMPSWLSDLFCSDKIAVARINALAPKPKPTPTEA